MKPETEYIINEVQHLLFCGMNAADITKALDRTPSSLAKLMYRNGYPELQAMFAKVRYEQGKEVA